MFILIILVAILVVYFVGGAFLESIGMLIGVVVLLVCAAIYAGVKIYQRKRGGAVQNQPDQHLQNFSGPSPKKIEVSCPCSKKLLAYVMPGDVLTLTCPQCGKKLRVDTNKKPK